jgi:hypothetical protein
MIINMRTCILKVFARYFIFCKVVKVIVVSGFFCHVVSCVYITFGTQITTAIVVNSSSSGSSDSHHRYLGSVVTDNDNVDLWKLQETFGLGDASLLYTASLYWYN